MQNRWFSWFTLCMCLCLCLCVCVVHRRMHKFEGCFWEQKKKKDVTHRMYQCLSHIFYSYLYGKEHIFFQKTKKKGKKRRTFALFLPRPASLSMASLCWAWRKVRQTDRQSSRQKVIRSY